MNTPAAQVDVWFPLYARDMLTGSSTFIMTNRQLGAFLRLLCHAWLQSPPASLPDHGPTLMKMADMGADEWEEDAPVLLAAFPAGEDGRRRNPRQWEIYQDASGRKERAVAKAKRAADSRWSRPATPAPPAPSIPPASSEDAPSIPVAITNEAIAEMLTPYGTLAEWRESAPERDAVLRRMIDRVSRMHGAQGVGGFAALANAALQGGTDGRRLTPEQLQSALEDWCDQDNAGTKNSLRAYLRGALPAAHAGAKRGGAENPPRATKLVVE